MGQTLVVPVQLNGVTGKNILRSNSIERRLVNGVRGSLRNTDGEWASWTRNDSIVMTFDMGARKKISVLSLGYLNDFGLAIHRPKKVEVWLSDNDVHYTKVSEKIFALDDVFSEGRFTDNVTLEMENTARYVRVIMKGAGECPTTHVRPGMEAQVYLDEVWIE